MHGLAIFSGAAAPAGPLLVSSLRVTDISEYTCADNWSASPEAPVGQKCTDLVRHSRG